MAIEKGLLLHWWHYYGKCIYTFKELLKFEEIIDKYGPDKVFEAALASYIVSDGSPTLMLSSIRNNRVEIIFETLPDPETFTGDKKLAYIEAKENFIKQISATYRLK